MVWKEFGLIALLGALSGCQPKSLVQAECRVDDLGVTVRISHHQIEGCVSGTYRSIEYITDEGHVLPHPSNINACQDVAFKCHDGSRIYIKNCVLHHEPAE